MELIEVAHTATSPIARRLDGRRLASPELPRSQQIVNAMTPASTVTSRNTRAHNASSRLARATHLKHNNCSSTAISAGSFRGSYRRILC